MQTLAETLQDFLKTLNSADTCRTYTGPVREALAALGATYPADLSPPGLAEYRAGLIARLDAKGERRLSPASVALKLAALRSFLKFCQLTGQTPISTKVINYVLKSPSTKVVKPYEVLTTAEARRVLAVLTDSPRDHALVVLALGAGLRSAELTAVRLSDIITDDEGGMWVHVVMGKGRKSRLVPLAPDVAAVLHEFISRRDGAKLRGADHLFPSRQGASGQLSTARVWQIIVGAVKAAGITKRLPPISFRHTYATLRMKAGTPVVIIQKFMGHASLQTTQTYLDHLDLADLREWAAPLPGDLISG